MKFRRKCASSPPVFLRLGSSLLRNEAFRHVARPLPCFREEWNVAVRKLGITNENRWVLSIGRLNDTRKVEGICVIVKRCVTLFEAPLVVELVTF